MTCCYGNNGSGPGTPGGGGTGGIPGGIDGVSGSGPITTFNGGDHSNDTKICGRCLMFWAAIALGAGIIIGAKKKK